MTSGNAPSTNDQLTLLTRKDLAGFDKLATELILEMQDEGWRGFITARGHASMRHPDGSVQSLTRSSNRAKSGTAMRARYESWKRRRAEAAAAAASTFGVLAEEPVSMPAPVATLAEMKKHPAVGPYMTDKVNTAGDEWRVCGFDENPRAWAVFDIEPAYPVLIGYGSATDEAGAWASLMNEAPELFPVPDPQPQGPVGESDQEDEMAKRFVCPEPGCDKDFEDQRRASVHNAAAHHREQVPCPEPGCDWFGWKTSLKRHHDNEHDATMHGCGICGRVFVTPAGLSTHTARSHKGQEAAPVTVTQGAVPVTPPEPVPSGDATVVSHATDVLMDHLEHLPEGADAEAMVAAVRSIVAGPLVAELRSLREQVVQLTAERDKFRTEAADFEARLTLMREVMGV